MQVDSVCPKKARQTPLRMTARRECDPRSPSARDRGHPDFWLFQGDGLGFLLSRPSGAWTGHSISRWARREKQPQILLPLRRAQGPQDDKRNAGPSTAVAAQAPRPSLRMTDRGVLMGVRSPIPKCEGPGAPGQTKRPGDCLLALDSSDSFRSLSRLTAPAPKNSPKLTRSSCSGSSFHCAP